MADQKLNLENEEDPEKAFNTKLKAIIDNDSGVAPETEEPETKQELQTLDVVSEAETTPETEEESGEGEADQKTLSKSDAAFVALRRELKKKEEELRVEKSKRVIETVTKQKEELTAKYVKEGYDAETAKYYAEKDMDLQDLRNKLEETTFTVNNSAIFEEYPDAKKDVSEIIKMMKLTGWSADRVCLAMYYEKKNPIQERAKAAVTGTLERKPASNSIASATRSAVNMEESGLSDKDVRSKRELESHFGAITKTRFLELKEKYGL